MGWKDAPVVGGPAAPTAMPPQAAPAPTMAQQGWQSAPVVADPSAAPLPAQQRYAQSLEELRRSQYADMSDAEWQAMVQGSKSISPMAPIGNIPVVGNILAPGTGDVEGAFAPYSQMEQAQQGQLFGLTDEISAATGALGSQVNNWLGKDTPGFGEAYGQRKALEEARRDVGREQNGALGAGMEVLGGLSSLGASPATAGAIAPSQAMANSVIGGSIFGGLYGAGSADQDRFNAGAQGAGVGAVVGRFAPALANAAGGAVRNVGNMFAENAAARGLGVSPGASRFMQETLAADGSLGAPGLARMQAAGQEGMLADAGPSARRMLDTAVQSSGRAGLTARDAITGRLNRDSEAITNALDRALGTPEGVNAARARIAQETSGARGSAYNAAYASPIDYSSESGRLLEDLIQRVPQAAIARANRLMQINGERSAQIMAQVADDGTVTYLRQPDVRQLDYITRALNQEAEAGIGMGAMGGQTDIGAGLQSLSGDIRSVLGNHVPEYENALNVAGDSIRRSQAVRLGADLINPSVTMEDVIRQSANLSPAEREGLAQGLRSQVDNLLARVKRTVGGGPLTDIREAQQALLRLSDRGTRTKIEAAIGEDLARPLFDELDRAGMSFELAQSVATGSDTFGRQEMNRRIGQLADGDGPIETLAKGEPVNATKRVVQALTGRTPDAALTRKDLINDEIVRLLTQGGGQGQRTMQTLMGLQQGSQRANSIAEALRLGGSSQPVRNAETQRYLAARK